MRLDGHDLSQSGGCRTFPDVESMRTSREARFEAIYRSYLPNVKRYAASCLGRDEVDDLVSDTFTAAWRRLDDIPAEAPLPWLLVACRQQSLNHQRAKRRFVALVEEITRSRPRIEVELVQHGIRPDTVLLFQSAVESLGTVDREILVLSAWIGLSDRQIAVVTESNPDRVRQRRHRLERRLAEQMRSADRAEDEWRVCGHG